LLDSPARTSFEAGQYLYGEHDDELLGCRLSPVPDDSRSAAAPHCRDSPLSLFSSKIQPLQFAPADDIVPVSSEQPVEVDQEQVFEEEEP
jgi:hypothetical protein